MIDILKAAHEERASLVEELDNILSESEENKRELTSEEEARYSEVEGEIDKLDSKIERLEKQEERKQQAVERKAKAEAALAAGAKVQEMSKEGEDVVKKYSFFDAYKTLKEQRAFDGIVKEMHDEASNEARNAGYELEGVAIPSWFVTEKRADIDQTNSAIQGTDVGEYVQSLRQDAVYSRVIPQSNILEGLSSDVNIQDVNAISTGWVAAENTTAADGGANLSKVTLSPIRLTSKANISKRLGVQNGPIVMRAIMSSMGSDAAEKIDAAIFSTTDVTNAIPAIAAHSGVLTFTEAATYAAPSATVNGTLYDDLIKAVQTLANNKAAQGALAIVGNTKQFTDLHNSPKVINVSGAVDNLQLGSPLTFNISGVPVYLTVSTTSNGTTSADFIAGDFRRAYVGFFGGMDMVVDPWSNADKAQDRLLFHRWLDSAVVQGEAFVKATSLLS